MPDPGNRIYIVDDDASVCRSLARLVKTYGYRPMTMSSGEEFANCKNLDLNATIICDLRMPGMNGVEVYQSLERRNIKLPFIFITAVDDDVLVDQAKRLGKAFFQKPLDGQELLGVLSTLSRT
jgi:FixJ family two-component response regulator